MILTTLTSSIMTPNHIASKRMIQNLYSSNPAVPINETLGNLIPKTFAYMKPICHN